MKTITLYVRQNCPTCIHLTEYLYQIQGENPAFANVPVAVIDSGELLKDALIRKHIHLPCVFLGDEKVYEGIMSKAALYSVFEQAINDV